MFTPRYSLIEPLLNNISTIERLYGRLEALRLPTQLQLNLERNNLVRSTYISNSIEGNPLTLPEVTNLLLGDRVPTNRDEKEVRNYFDILKGLDHYKRKAISLDTITSIHKRLLAGVRTDIAGIVRNEPVAVGSYYFEEGVRKLNIQHLSPFQKQKDVLTALQQLLVWLASATIPVPLAAGIFHHQFVYIHPFGDGNGRTCRVLTALFFLQKGYAINKYFVLDDYYDIDRHEYSQKLHTADSGDKTQWLHYFTDGVKYSLQGALAKAKEAMSTLSISHQPTPQERKVLAFFQHNAEITSAMIVKKFSVSRQQAHKLLQGLVERGLVKKIGGTKASYYVIA